MTENKTDTRDQATQVLRDMKERHNLNTLECWAIDHATCCIERDKKVRNTLTRTEQAIRETEGYLTAEFEAFQEPADVERYLDIESRR